MPRVLVDLGQRLNVGEPVLARLLHFPFDSQSPVLKIDSRVEDVIAVVRELLEWGDLVVRERRRQMMRAEKLPCCPVAETDAMHQQVRLQLREGEHTYRRDRRQLEQFPSRDLLQPLFFNQVIHRITPSAGQAFLEQV